MLSIRQAGEADIDLTTEFFMRLWPEHEYNELREEIAGIIREKFGNSVEILALKTDHLETL